MSSLFGYSLNNSSGDVDYSNINSNVTINGDLTTNNIINTGTLTTIESIDLKVYDKNILLNSNASGLNTSSGSGITIRDNNNDNQGYIKTSSDSTTFQLKAPNNNFILNTPSLTTNSTIATTDDTNSKISRNGDTMTGNLILNTGANLFVNQPWNPYDGFNCDIAGFTRIKNGPSNPDALLYLEPLTGVNKRYFIGVNNTTGLMSMGRGASTIQIDSSTSNFISNLSTVNFNSNDGLTNYLSIANTGNVGIGTTSAGNKLVVNGNITTSSTSQYIKSCGFMSNNAGLVSDFGASDLGFVALSGSSLAVVTTGVERMRINNVGNVGIGTSAPNGKLCLNGRGIVDANIPFQTHCLTNSQAFFGINYGTEAVPDYNTLIGCVGGDTNIVQMRNYDMLFKTNNVERMRISKTGRLGINVIASGTTDVDPYLIVKGRFEIDAISAVDTSSVIVFKNNASNLSYLFVDNLGNFYFQPYSNRTGLGKTPTTYGLEVAGNASKTVGGTTWIDASDRRIKENIEDADLDILYDNIKNIKLHYYRKIEKYSPYEKDRHQIGVIAQELKEGNVYPKAVDVIPSEKFEIGKDSDGKPIYEELADFHTVNYDQLYKANLGATQKLIQKVEQQQLVIDLLLERLTNLENKLLQ